MCEERYQGWKNRETWAMNLWITNDEGLYNEAKELVAGKSKFEGAGALKGWMEDMISDFWETPQDFNRDFRLMLQDVGSVWRVEWADIAEGLQED